MRMLKTLLTERNDKINISTTTHNCKETAKTYLYTDSCRTTSAVSQFKLDSGGSVNLLRMRKEDVSMCAMPEFSATSSLSCFEYVMENQPHSAPKFSDLLLCLMFHP